MATAVFFHAHPDDEAIATGGTMAKMAAAGHRVVLVTATRGELGLVPEDLAPGATLDDRRAAELDAACAVLGVARHEYLGYRDSGMEGEPTNEDPSCFWRVDVDEAAERLCALLQSEHAEILTAYDERGTYGHPDHIQVHRVGLRAAEMAGTSRVFMATVNRDHVRGLTQRAEEFGAAEVAGNFEERREEFEGLGVPAERITTAVDVSQFLDQKRRAMAAHTSQIAETSFFLAMPPEAFAVVWGTEWYMRLGVTPGEPYETSLLA
ncbi:MAG: PIG-L family deacetylase [Acidimicrobiales bacterium]